jgi:hypothetical protein
MGPTDPPASAPLATAAPLAAASLSTAAKPAAAIAPESPPTSRLHRKHCEELQKLCRGGRRLVRPGRLYGQPLRRI